MIHAILEDLLTPEQAREHLRLIDQHLSTPDGVRLFDRPMPYHGGLQKLFQRAETATFFGREIGLMYMHAHLRYAQALAHVGEAEKFLHALCQANPIGIRSIVPRPPCGRPIATTPAPMPPSRIVTRRARNISASGAGSIALDGGWRVYSSGAGIALGLIVRRFLGVSQEARHPARRSGHPGNARRPAGRVDPAWDEPVELIYQIKGAGLWGQPRHVE